MAHPVHLGRAHEIKKRNYHNRTIHGSKFNIDRHCVDSASGKTCQSVLSFSPCVNMMMSGPYGATIPTTVG